MKNPSAPESAPTGSSREVTVVSVLVGFAVVATIMVLTAIQGTATFTQPRIGDLRITQTPEPPMTVTPGTPLPTGLPSSVAAGVLATIAGVIGILLIAVVLAFLVRLFIRWLRDLPPRRIAGAVVGGGIAAGASDPDAEVVRRVVDDAIVAFDGQREPGDAVVEAWVTLESTVASGGLVRAPSETAGEFAVRVIGHRGDVATDAVALLHAYEDVRYGGVVVDDNARRAVRAHLVRIREEWR